jgi:trimeric autotransporter adhesin
MAATTVLALTSLASLSGLFGPAAQQQQVEPELVPWISPTPLHLPLAPVRGGGDMAVVGDTLYVAGVHHVAPCTGSSASIDANDGEVQIPWPDIGGKVYVVLGDGEGGWYVGGDFPLVGGQPRRNLARIAWDGTLLPFAPQVEGGYVYALALSGSTLYVGGSFEQVNTTARDHLAAVDAATGDIVSWNPTAGANWTSPQRVSDLEVAAGVVFVAGEFVNGLGGATRSHLGAVDATSGLALAWNPSPSQPVWSIEVVAGSKLAVAGGFPSIAGAIRDGIAVFDLATLLLDPFAPTIDGWVSSIDSLGTVLYACGDVDGVDGSPRRGGAAFELTNGALLDWDPRVTRFLDDGDIQAMAVGAEGVFVAGDFEFSWLQRRRGCARLDLATGQPHAWTAHIGGLSDDVFTMGYEASRAAIGGWFTHVGGELRGGAAAWSLLDGSLLPWAPEFAGSQGLPGGPIAIEADATRVYFGGQFQTVDGVQRSHVAAVDAVTGALDPGFQVPGSFHPSSDFINQLELGFGRLYASGTFNLAGGTMRNIAAFDATTGAPLPGFACHASYVNDLELASHGTRLYVGGNFSEVGIPPVDVARLAWIDPFTGAVANWDAEITGGSGVTSLQRAGDSLLACGTFISVGGQPIQHLTRIDSSTAAPAPWAVSVPGLSSVSRFGLAVFLTRDSAFQVNGQYRNGLAAVHGRTGATLSWDPDPDRAPLWAFVEGDRLIVTGDFHEISGVRQANLAVYTLIQAPPQ